MMSAVRVSVRVRPGASRTRVGGCYDPGDGHPCLIVAVTAPAVDGKATAAVCRAVAAAFSLPPRAVTLIRGDRARTKLLALEIDPVQGQERLQQLLRA